MAEDVVRLLGAARNKGKLTAAERKRAQSLIISVAVHACFPVWVHHVHFITRHARHDPLQCVRGRERERQRMTLLVAGNRDIDTAV